MKSSQNTRFLPVPKIPRILFILVCILIVFTGCQPVRQIQNPYSSVDWAKYGQYKANLHTHTMVTDGWMNPQTVVEKYRERGYRILAITDHRAVVYPWQEFTKFKVGGKTDQRVRHVVLKPQEDEPIYPQDTVYKNVIPSEKGMVDIQGGELWFKNHELNCFFSDYCGTDSEGFLDTLTAKGGIAVMNHPGRYKLPATWYVDLYQQYSPIVGFEVFNCDNRYSNDRKLWDSILTVLAPVRPVWGFSNDDMHSMRDLGKDWNVFLLPEANQKNVRYAMENGISYFIHAPMGHKGVPPPAINSIRVNSKHGVVSIKASGYNSIIWVSEGNIIHKGKRFHVRKLPAENKYVRAELYGNENSIVCTQPFFVK